MIFMGRRPIIFIQLVRKSLFFQSFLFVSKLLILLNILAFMLILTDIYLFLNEKVSIFSLLSSLILRLIILSFLKFLSRIIHTI